ncbi:hypothetical protein [Actinoplanes sp. NPDC049316]|uniref:hypothetical protein n=1 Tax=Actinoplanes sp. NPDC049316 TaxID=3154727 RepID=UPI003425D4C3
MILGLDNYTAIKDGGAFATRDCPACGADAVVWDAFQPEVLGPRGVCFGCGETWHDHCERCGNP